MAARSPRLGAALVALATLAVVSGAFTATPSPDPTCRCAVRAADGSQLPCAKESAGSPSCPPDSVTCPSSPLSSSEPPAVVGDDLSPWNDPAVRVTHNCYSFAMRSEPHPPLVAQCDGTTDPARECLHPFEEPGNAIGRQRALWEKPLVSCSYLHELLAEEIPDIALSSFGQPCPEGTSKVATVAQPNMDVHFFRQTSSGWYEHKPGQFPVTNTDASGRIIINPQHADLDYSATLQYNYSQFCAFYCVPRGPDAVYLVQTVVPDSAAAELEAAAAQDPGLRHDANTHDPVAASCCGWRGNEVALQACCYQAWGSGFGSPTGDLTAIDCCNRVPPPPHARALAAAMAMDAHGHMDMSMG